MTSDIFQATVLYKNYFRPIFLVTNYNCRHSIAKSKDKISNINTSKYGTCTLLPQSIGLIPSSYPPSVSRCFHVHTLLPPHTFHPPVIATCSFSKPYVASLHGFPAHTQQCCGSEFLNFFFPGSGLNLNFGSGSVSRSRSGWLMKNTFPLQIK